MTAAFIAVIALTVFIEILHYKQTRDFALLLKSKDLREYEAAKEIETQKIEVPEIAAIPLDELEPDKALEVIRKELNQEENEVD